MMSEKLGKTCTRWALADRLEQLARQLRSGKLELDEYSGEIPESLEMEFHVREKKAQIRCKLEFRWSSLGGYAGAEQHEIRQWQNSFKQVKKPLAQSFKQLKKNAQGQLTAEDPSLQAFVAASRAFAAVAAPEWPEAIQEYLAHLENLMRATEKQEQESILHELQDLENNMISCHRELR
jgi:XXXCH domain-containing protein